jgi:enoyl-CoA hydratase/carnithine racemase
MGDLVTSERIGDVVVLTLRRPQKLNAISADVERELGRMLDDEQVQESRAVVLAGEGRAFSAGADVTEFRDRDPAACIAYYRETGAVYERFATLPLPTFVAIHGYCLGGALELALAADFRIADESAVFGFPEVAFGILPSSGGTHRLVRLLGTARAKELTLLRERLDARTALAAGLVTEVVPEGSALTRALELAERVAALPQLAVSLTKEAIAALGESSREAALLVERLGYAALAQTDEARDAVDSFVRRGEGDQEGVSRGS